MTGSAHRYVLLDRDGVLNVDRPGSVRSLAELEMIPGAAVAVAEINRKGFGVLVVTNQACVARGELSIEELGSIHAEIERQVAESGGRIDGWYVCTHGDGDRCDCRKPAPGLIFRAQRDHGFASTDTWMIGDAMRDIQAAEAAGCRPGLVLTGKGRTFPCQLPSEAVFEDLSDFARSLRSSGENDPTR